MLDSVSLAPVLLGRRGDDQPVRQTLLIQSSPGRDAFTERDPATGGTEPAPKAKKKKAAAGKTSMTAQDREKARNEAWNQAAKKGAQSGSHGMAHALREGPWKLVFDIENDQPAALYNLKDDLAERTNVIAVPANAARVKSMEKLYRDIRSSKRSTPAAGS
jgi:hypothetical protein